MAAHSVFPFFNRHQQALIIVVHCLFFAFVAWLFLPNLDIDMFENYAWGQTLAWGSFKHPPFFAWITRLWFMVWPTNNFSYFCLSYFNAGIGLFGVLSLTKVLLEQNSAQLGHSKKQFFLLLVLGFSLLGLPFNFYAAIFNADSISLSLWPWTAYVFFRGIGGHPAEKKWIWTVWLAVLSAASVLGKYYAVVFLLSLFYLSLSKREYRAWYKTPHPYACFLFFMMLLLPHGLWEYQMRFPFTSYYSHYFNGFKKIISHVFTFCMTGIYFFVLSWFVWLFVQLKSKKTHSETAPCIPNHLFWGLCIAPLVFTLVISLIAGISVMDRWAIPLWFALPIFMANQLSTRLESLWSAFKWVSYAWVGLIILVVVAFGEVLFSSCTYLGRHHDYLEARKEMALSIEKAFQVNFSGQNIAWVGGNVWPDHLAPLSYYLVQHPRAFPGFPDQMPALVNPYLFWQQKNGVIVCGKKVTDPEAVINQCVDQTQAWLKANHLLSRKQEIVYQAQGWRWLYLGAPKKRVVVFWVIPNASSTCLTKKVVLY